MAAMPFPSNDLLLCCVNIPTVLLMFIFGMANMPFLSNGTLLFLAFYLAFYIGFCQPQYNHTILMYT